MVLDIHCPEILQSPGKFAGLAPNVGWKEEGSWNFTITQMIAYVGRAYCKEHTIPVVKTVAPFLRDFPFHIHFRLPINAVQFTILSIIAMGYKPAVAYYRSECYRYCWPISITQQLIKRYSMLSAPDIKETGLMISQVFEHAWLYNYVGGIGNTGITRLAQSEERAAGKVGCMCLLYWPYSISWLNSFTW